MKRIQLTQGKHAIVEDQDYPLVSQYKWIYSSKGYAITHNPQNNKQWIWMHRLIMSTPKDLQTDHINGNKLDNRRSNLRICTSSQNRVNIIHPINSTSTFRGVSWNKEKNRWSSQIQVNNKRILIGRFNNERHAAIAYDLWARDIFGEFSLLNFKEPSNH